MNKEKIRAQIKNARNALSKADRDTKNKAIRAILESHPDFQKAQNILFYVSKEEEVDTKAIIQDILGKKTILVPRVIKQNSNLEINELKKWDQLKTGKYGILEMKGTKITPYKGKIDLIIVPGIAFDHHGNRLGYGKSYYDALLKKYPLIPKIGLAYQLQIVEKIPNEAHDIPIKIILTEEKTIHT